MKLIQSLDKVIAEATAREIYDKYYSHNLELGRGPFIQIVSADPKTIIKGEGGSYDMDRIVKIGKYSKILLDMYIKGNLELEDLPRATEYLEYVYKYRIPIDSRDVRTLSDIYRIVSRYITKNTHSFDTLLQHLNPDEYDKVYETDKWVIYIPKTEKSACYLGVNTEWCTSWGKHSIDKRYAQRNNYFYQYNRKGPLYVIVNKEDFGEKYQFHFETKQFMNTADSKINIEEFFNRPDTEKLLKFFIPGLFKKITNKDEFERQLERASLIGPKFINVFLSRQYGEEFSNNDLISCFYDEDCDNIDQEFISIQHDNDVIWFDADLDVSYSNDIFNRITEVGTDIIYSKVFDTGSNNYQKMYDYVLGKPFVLDIIIRVLELYSENTTLMNYFGYNPDYKNNFSRFYEMETGSKYTRDFSNLVSRVSSEYLDYYYISSKAFTIKTEINKYVQFERYERGNGTAQLIIKIPRGKLINFILRNDINSKYELDDMLGLYFYENGIDNLLDEYFQKMKDFDSETHIRAAVEDDDLSYPVLQSILTYVNKSGFIQSTFENRILRPMREFSSVKFEHNNLMYFVVGDYNVKFLDLLPVYLDEDRVDIMVNKIGDSTGSVIRDIDIYDMHKIKRKLNVSDTIKESSKTYKRIMDKF